MKSNFDIPGYIYLICFDKKLHHAKHYIGWTENIDNRLDNHKNGNGACILKALNKKNIDYKIVKIWKGTRYHERKMKLWKNSKILCPLCTPKPSFYFDFLGIINNI